MRLTALQDPQDIYAGNVEYSASNGWLLVVFNDCNEFDYVDAVRNATGSIDYDQLEGTDGDWRPDDATAWRCLGIPGHCMFRCYGCGAPLPDARARRGPVEPPFYCAGAKCARTQSPAEPSWISVGGA